VRYSLMPSKHALNVSLTEHLSGFIDAQVASGRFGTASEVVRAALRLLEQDLAPNGASPASAAPQVPSAAIRTAGVT
jgi:antitoxin ParD1/3/4